MLAVDNLNGIELCGRTVCCDHVKQYKIPKEFMYLSDSEEKEDKKDKDANNDGSKDGDDKDDENKSDVESDDSAVKEEKAREKWEKKLYKPTGPDGLGWGDFRKMTG